MVDATPVTQEPPSRRQRTGCALHAVLFLVAAPLAAWLQAVMPGCRDSAARFAVAVGWWFLLITLATVLLMLARLESVKTLAVRWAMVAAALAVYMLLAFPNMFGAVERGRQKRTMGDMRTIATALDDYAKNDGSWPVARSANEVAAATGYALPLEDGWGSPFFVESGPSGYCIVSYGLCGELDRDVSTPADWCRPDAPKDAPNGGTTSYQSDMVFTGGSFVRFPDGTQN